MSTAIDQGETVLAEEVLSLDIFEGDTYTTELSGIVTCNVTSNETPGTSVVASFNSGGTGRTITFNGGPGTAGTVSLGQQRVSVVIRGYK